MKTMFAENFSAGILIPCCASIYPLWFFFLFSFCCYCLHYSLFEAELLISQMWFLDDKGAQESNFKVTHDGVNLSLKLCSDQVCCIYL